MANEVGLNGMRRKDTTLRWIAEQGNTLVFIKSNGKFFRHNKEGEFVDKMEDAGIFRLVEAIGRTRDCDKDMNIRFYFADKEGIINCLINLRNDLKAQEDKYEQLQLNNVRYKTTLRSLADKLEGSLKREAWSALP